MPIANRLYAEFLGTFWLVLGGCGSAVLAAGFPSLGIGFAGVALAVGLSGLPMGEAPRPGVAGRALRGPRRPRVRRGASAGRIAGRPGALRRRIRRTRIQPRERIRLQRL